MASTAGRHLFHEAESLVQKGSHAKVHKSVMNTVAFSARGQDAQTLPIRSNACWPNSWRSHTFASQRCMRPPVSGRSFDQSFVATIGVPFGSKS